jgi:chromosomal replication initiation ATPase DnaA
MENTTTIGEPFVSDSEWGRIRRQILSHHVGAMTYAEWFEDTRQLAFEEGHLTVLVPNQVSAVHLGEHYYKTVVNAANAVGIKVTSAQFIAAETESRDKTPSAEAAATEA